MQAGRWEDGGVGVYRNRKARRLNGGRKWKKSEELKKKTFEEECKTGEWSNGAGKVKIMEQEKV